jgi:superfamily I DNA and RNA helicase
VGHALGLGIYREEGLIQHFDDPSLWSDIGYQVVDGDLAPGEPVVLRRAPDSYPGYFRELLDPSDVVQFVKHKGQFEQATWVARSIQQDLSRNQLEHEDILVVLPSTYTAEKDSQPIREALERLGIDSHLAGVTSSRDEIFRPGSIALANIHRSKGNEAAMVYIVNAQQCINPYQTVTMRNTLFTGITRSRAWVRIVGWGSRLDTIGSEVADVVSNDYTLQFKVPTTKELGKIRQIHRERSASERQRIRQTEQSLRSAISALERGDMDLEDLPSDVRLNLLRLLSQESPTDDFNDGV